jgi:hypothetical protein
LRVTAGQSTLEVNQNTRIPVPNGSQWVLDPSQMHLGYFSIDKGQAPQRVVGDNQFVAPANPAPDATDSRNGQLFKLGMTLPVAVVIGQVVYPAELIATTIGTRSSVEGLLAKVANDFNTAMATGRDVAVSVTFGGTHVVPMGAGNSYALNFSDIQIIDTPKVLVEFREQFKSLLAHAKRTPPKVPASLNFSAPANFAAPGVSTAFAPAPVAYAQAPVQVAPTAQTGAQPVVSPGTGWQMPTLAPQAALVQSVTEAAWMQAPQPPMAPMAPPAPDKFVG